MGEGDLAIKSPKSLLYLIVSSKITNIGVERELTGSENERRKGYKREARNVWRERLR